MTPSFSLMGKACLDWNLVKRSGVEDDDWDDLAAATDAERMGAERRSVLKSFMAAVGLAMARYWTWWTERVDGGQWSLAFVSGWDGNTVE